MFEEFTKDFFDPIFYWISAICFALIAIDWAIGPNHRQRVRDEMGNWWLHLGEMSFTRIATKNSEILHKSIQRVFGMSWYGRRMIILSVTLSAVVMSSTWSISILTSGDSFFENLYKMAPLATVLLLPNGIADWLSLALTQYFLRKISNTQNAITVLVFLLLDFILSFVILYVTLVAIFGVASLADSITGGTEHFLGGLKLVFVLAISIVSLSTEIYNYGNEGLIALYAQMTFLLCGILTSIIPTLLYSVYLSATIGLKLLGPVVKPLIMFLLYRFQESEKGVLSQIAIGVGAFTKLIQQAFKVWGA